MLCSLKAFTFIFYAGCVFVMTVFVFFFYIETKGVPIEMTPFIFKEHWFWKRYANLSVGIQERLVLQRMAQEAQEKGEPIPDIPGIREAMEDKDLMKRKEEIAAKNKTLMRGSADVETKSKK
jgi:hypothetical protein